MSNKNNDNLIELIKESATEFEQAKNNLAEVGVGLTKEEWNEWQSREWWEEETDKEKKIEAIMALNKFYEQGLDELFELEKQRVLEKEILTEHEVAQISPELDQEEIGEWIKWCMQDSILAKRYTPEELQEKFKDKRLNDKRRFLYLLTNHRIKLNQFLNEL